MTTPIWQIACAMLAYTAFLFAANELARRHVRWFVFPQAILVAIVPFLIPDLSGSWFQVSKILTTTFPCLVVSLSRMALQEGDGKALRFFGGPWKYAFAYIAIEINILETVVADLQGGWYFNAFSGLVLGLTLPNAFKDKAWFIETETPRRDALVNLSTVWTVLYTTWNLACLYAQDPAYLAHVASLLAAPLAYSLILRRPDLWMGARVYTSSIAVMILWGGHDFVTPFMDTTPLRSEQAVAWWGIVNSVLLACYLAHWLARSGRLSWKASGGAPGLEKATLRSSAAD
jgi:hypothetical protein